MAQLLNNSSARESEPSFVFPSLADKASLGSAYGVINEFGYGDLNSDAVWKWAKIINTVHSLTSTRPLSKMHILDIGGGLSFLHLYFSQFSKITNVELLGFQKTWFPTDRSGLYVGATQEFKQRIRRDNIEYIHDNFFSFAERTESNRFDFIIDGCSIIHFNMSLFSNKELAISKVGCEIKRLLKPNGYFISSTHCAHPDSYEYRDMVFLETIINGYLRSDLDRKFDLNSLILPQVLRDKNRATKITNGHMTAQHKKNSYKDVLDPCQCCEYHGLQSSRPNTWINVHLTFQKSLALKNVNTIDTTLQFNSILKRYYMIVLFEPVFNIIRIIRKIKIKITSLI